MSLSASLALRAREPYKTIGLVDKFVYIKNAGRMGCVALCTSVLVACGGSNTAGAATGSADANGKNFFVAPLHQDIVEGRSKEVPGGAYWDARREERKRLKREELAVGTCSSQWGRSFIGIVPYKTPFYPAQNATYWFYSMHRDETGAIPAIRITGEYPHARYMSYNVYDNDTGYATASVGDIHVQADPGSKNPFLPGADRNVANRKYTLWFVSERDTKTIAALREKHGESNVVIIEDSVKSPGIAIRVYLPDAGRDLYGDTGLPAVHSLNPQAAEVASSPVACPAAEDFGILHVVQLLRSGQDRARLSPKTDTFRDVRFYFSPGGGAYPNADARYGGTLLNPGISEDHEVTQVRFRAPTTTLTKNNPDVRFAATDEMRYWSFCMNGLKSTLMSRCINDEQVVKDEQGYVTVVMAHNDSAIKKHIAENMSGINFMTYDGFKYPVILLRHMVPNKDFKTSFHDGDKLIRPENIHGKVDSQTGEPQAANGIEKYWADQAIGDYSPVGRTCSADEFIANSGCY